MNRPARPAVSPPVDFPVYGLVPSWPGERWLDSYGDSVGDVIRWLRLAHRSRQGGGLVMVETHSRARTDAQSARTGEPALESVSFGAALVLVNLTLPAGSVARPPGMLHALADRATESGKHFADWEPLTWRVDGTPVPARTWRFAGGWAAFSDAVDDVYLAAAGQSGSPDDVELVRLPDSAGYRFDLTRPLHPRVIAASLAAAEQPGTAGAGLSGCRMAAVGVTISAMPTFSAADGTELAYHVIGDGAPLLCLPGGPGRASAYLGDLGGLAARRRLIVLDSRGTGDSAIPADPGSYRCDRLTQDVVALQRHLGLDRFDLLGHSAGANVAVQYAVRHRRQVSRLLLITPSGRSAGLAVEHEMRREVMNLRHGEPWFAEGMAVFERGPETDQDWAAMAPFFYGRWDDAAQAHFAAGEEEGNEDAARGFDAEGAFDPEADRAAAATFAAPVLLLAGGGLVWQAVR